MKQASGVTRIARSIVAVTCVVAAYGGITTNTSSASTDSAQGATDASAHQTAKAALVSLQDLGAGWTRYRKAGGVLKGYTKDCSTKFGSPLKISDRSYSGPMFRDATKTTFAYSYSYVFQTEAEAKAYTAVRSTPAFTQCRVAQDDAVQKKADPKTFVKIYETTTDAVGGGSGLEAYYSEQQGSKGRDGADAVGAEYLRLTYRHGRVVYLLSVDAGLASEQAGALALNDRITKAVADMNTAIEARLTALGA